MVSISDSLVKSLYSNSIPRAKIKIQIKKLETIKGQAGPVYIETVMLTFTEKDVTNVKFSQSIDITGSELPMMKLEWEQNKIGEIYEQLAQTGHYGVQEKMAVDFSIIYETTSYNYWGDYPHLLKKWYNFYEDGETWGDVFYSKKDEEVKTKKLFLSSLPKIDGDKIKWEARDLLYFLNGTGSEYTNFFIPTGKITELYPVNTREGLVRSILGKESIRLFNSNDKSLDEAIQSTEFDDFDYEKNALLEEQIFVGVAKDLLKNCLSPINYFIDFSKGAGSLSLKNADSVVESAMLEPQRRFLLKNQTETPKITVGSDISSYIFETSTFFVDYEDSYMVSASKIIYEQGEGYTSHIFYTDGPSTRFSKDGSTYPEIGNDYYVYEDLNWIRYDIKGEYLTPFELKLYRIKSKSTTTTYSVNENGLEFEEKNPLNPFLEIGNRNFAIDRINFLSKYYNSKKSGIVVKCFGDPSIEPCDLISVETNLINKDTGENIIKKGIVKSTELSYNGAIKETITLHEIF